MVGLGVMGRNFLLNMADHGHSVAGYDLDAAKVAALRQEAEHRNIRGATEIREFIALLRRPRAVMLLVPAGPPVDAVINDLLAHLQPGDLIIDAGNSYFKDTDVRARNLAAKARSPRSTSTAGGSGTARSSAACPASVRTGTSTPRTPSPTGHLPAVRARPRPRRRPGRRRPGHGASGHGRRGRLLLGPAGRLAADGGGDRPTARPRSPSWSPPSLAASGRPTEVIGTLGGAQTAQGRRSPTAPWPVPWRPDGRPWPWRCRPTP